MRGSDRALSVGGVAELLGVSVDTVKAIPPAALPFFRTQGGHRRYQREDVDRYVESRRVAT